MTESGLTIGVSLKMYFGQRQTLDWCREVAAIARRHPAAAGGGAELFVLPAAPLTEPVLRIFDGTGVGVGAPERTIGAGQRRTWSPARSARPC